MALAPFERLHERQIARKLSSSSGATVRDGDLVVDLGRRPGSTRDLAGVAVALENAQAKRPPGARGAAPAQLVRTTPAAVHGELAAAADDANRAPAHAWDRDTTRHR